MVMPIPPVPGVTLTPVAYFPEKYFLENLAVRAYGSVLITAVLQKELWCVPGPEPRADVRPVLVHTFEHMVSGIAEVEPDVFILCVSDAYESHESYLVRIDLKDWAPGDPVSPETIYTFDERAGGLNGSCLVGSDVLLIADSFAGLIWRVDLGPGARSATARIWLAHDTMAMDPDSGVPWPPQPGINGVRFGAQSGYLFYTSTAQKVFMRVAVDAKTLEPAGNAEFIAAVDNGDDFCLDENAGFAYVTRHRANTVDRVPLTPDAAAKSATSPEIHSTKFSSARPALPGVAVSTTVGGWPTSRSTAAPRPRPTASCAKPHYCVSNWNRPTARRRLRSRNVDSRSCGFGFVNACRT
jgi:hypothetical protein